MFLHFPQVIDSKKQKGGSGGTKFWKLAAIVSINLLNKWDDSAGGYLVEALANLPLCLLNPSSGTVLSNSDQVIWWPVSNQGATHEGIERKVIRQKTGLPVFKFTPLISTPDTRSRNQFPGQTPPGWL